MPCTAGCVAKGGDWKGLGECLSKRVGVVVCKPADSDIAVSGSLSASQSSTGSAVGSGTTSGLAASRSASGSGGQASASASASTGSGSGAGTIGKGGVKTAVIMFGTLAFISLFGMIR